MASCAWDSSQEASSAAALAETHMHRAFERFGDGTVYEFLPSAVESFRQLG